MVFRSKIALSVIALMLSLGIYGLLHGSTTTQFSYSTESFMAQSGNMSSTTLFTPTVDGNYQVTVAIEFVASCCGASDGNNVSPTLTWSDNTQSFANTPNTFFARPNQVNNASTVAMRVSAGTPVQLSTMWNNSGGTSNDSYNVFVTVIGN